MCLGNLRFYQTHPDRHLIPCSAFEYSPSSFLLHSAPLLEEKWDVGSEALISNIRDPFLQDRSGAWAKLAVVFWIPCFQLYNLLAKAGN